MSGRSRTKQWSDQNQSRRGTMRSTTLSPTIFRAHASPLPPKPLAHCFFNLRSDRSKKQSQLISLWSLSRFSEPCRATKCESTSEFEDGLEFRYLDLENCKETTGPSQSLDGCCDSDEPFVNNDLGMECYVPPSDIVSDTSFGGSLKFMMLTGLLTFHGSQPALAVPDIASMLQSNPYFGDLDDINTGFASAFLLIFFSELGDKTFFIAALLAARNSAAVVFVGTFGALAAMTVISVVLGRSFHYVDELLPFRFGETDLPVDDIAAVCLLVYFGVSTLLDAGSSDAKAEDEQKEAELAVSEFSGNGAGILAAAGTIASTFLLVFVAEWGDKSFFSTIALAAASSPLGVIGGALAGHGAATLLAVLGGSLLGTFLSEKVIAYTGGVLFLVFAVITLVEIVS